MCGRSVWACELGCLNVWLNMCGCLRLWCRVALCSLCFNSIGDKGTSAISRGLASVPQLQRLEYVVAVCALVVPLRPRDHVTQTCGAGMPVCGQSVCERASWGACVCGATCVHGRACGVVLRCAA